MLKPESLDNRLIDASRGVIVAHPGTQYSYETALAVQKAGLLWRYLTGFYYKPEGALGRLGPFRGYTRDVVRWRNRWFDGLVGRVVAQEKPAALICYNGCALKAFDKAKSLGIFCILDQSIAHIRTGLKLLPEMNCWSLPDQGHRGDPIPRQAAHAWFGTFTTNGLSLGCDIAAGRRKVI